jgi:hypothetical protein
MQFSEWIRGDRAMGLRPFQEALHEPSSKADHVKRPYPSLFEQPFLQARYGQLAGGAFDDR